MLPHPRLPEVFLGRYRQTQSQGEDSSAQICARRHDPSNGAHRASRMLSISAVGDFLGVAGNKLPLAVLYFETPAAVRALGLSIMVRPCELHLPRLQFSAQAFWSAAPTTRACPPRPASARLLRCRPRPRAPSQRLPSPLQRGWAEDEAPTPAPGLRVTAFARGLDHPRWLHVLPNGDVLVAESNAQPSRPKSLRDVVMKLTQGIAGAEVAEPRSHPAAARRRRRRRRRDPNRLPVGADVALRHGAGRRRPVRRRHRCPASLPLPRRRDAHCRPGRRGGRIARRRDQSPLDQGAWSPAQTGGRCSSRSARTAITARTESTPREGRAAIREIDPATGATKVFAVGPAQPGRHGFRAAHRNAVDCCERARRARRRSGA